jgi:hypothetical protein
MSSKTVSNPTSSFSGPCDHEIAWLFPPIVKTNGHVNIELNRKTIGISKSKKKEVVYNRPRTKQSYFCKNSSG